MSLSAVSPVHHPIDRPIDIRRPVSHPAPRSQPVQPQIPADRVSLSPASLSDTSPASGGERDAQ